MFLLYLYSTWQRTASSHNFITNPAVRGACSSTKSTEYERTSASGKQIKLQSLRHRENLENTAQELKA